MQPDRLPSGQEALDHGIPVSEEHSHELLQRLRARAERERRSLTGEILHLLETAVPEPIDRRRLLEEVREVQQRYGLKAGMPEQIDRWMRERREGRGGIDRPGARGLLRLEGSNRGRQGLGRGGCPASQEEAWAGEVVRVLVDTKVLVAFVTGRNATQRRSADRRRGARREILLLLHQQVLSETSFVLTQLYERPVSEVREMLSSLVGSGFVAPVDALLVTAA